MTSARGERAAYSPHRRLPAKARRAVNRLLRAIARPVRAQEVDSLLFVPAVRSSEELADLLARISWYLPTVPVPIHVAGAEGLDARPEDAPHMDPALVRREALSDGLPTGRVRYVLHRTTPVTLARQVPHLRRTTVADAGLSYTSEHGYRRLRDALAPTGSTRPQALGRLLAARGTTSLVLGTGPSATALRDEDLARADVRILCNSAVLNAELVQRIAPTVICFADPLFHLGPNRYAAAFRGDLLRAVTATDATVVVPEDFVPLLLHHYPELEAHLVGLSFTRPEWGWPSEEHPDVKASGNVLTDLMLPVALALSDHALVAGCDGRGPRENYFWKHSSAVQYDGDLMGTVFEAHPAFFAGRSYVDYYERHCRNVEELCQVAEGAGKSVEGVTPSHIPALTARGATRIES